MMAEKARRFNDHREVELIMSSPDPTTHKRNCRGVRNLTPLFGQREAKCRVICQLRLIHLESRHETSPFELWQQTFGRSQPSGPSVGHWSPGG